jgi:hypothetical protein
VQFVIVLFTRFLAIAAMIGFYFLIKWLMTGFGQEFANGMFIGIMMTLGLTILAWKISPESFRDPRDKN